MGDNIQDTLFGDPELFRVEFEEWKGMPEYKHEDLTPWKTIKVHFVSQEDLTRFAKLLNQPITVDTRSIWYPEAEIGSYVNKRYKYEP